MIAAARLTLLRFCRDRFAATVLVGVMLVPAIYGGLLVWAYWDPYARSDKIPAVIVNLDQPVKVNGQTVDLGSDLEKEILASNTLVWTKGTEAEAREGLENKTYYVVLTIPKGFSQQMASIATDKPQRGVLSVRTNDAGNFLVGVLAKDAVSAVQGEASAAVQQSYLKVVYDEFDPLQAAVDQVSDGATALEEGAQQIVDGAKQVAQGTDDISAVLDEVATAVSKADKSIQGIPDRAKQISDDVAALSTTASGALTNVNQLVAQLQDLSDQLTANDQPQLAAKVDQVITTFQTDVVPASQGIADDADAAAQKAAALSDDASDGVKAADQAVTATNQLADAAKELSSGAQDLQTALSEQLEPGLKQLSDGLAAVAGTDIPITGSSSKTFTSVLSSPVEIDRKIDNPIAHFGEGFAPYFVGMGLFVGAVFVFLVLSPLDRRLQLWNAPLISAALAPLIAGAVVVVGQAALLFGALYAVGVRPADPGVLAGVLAVSAISYVAIMQALKAAFGLIGEFIGVIVLVLQVAAGEGAYPIQTFGAFFQTVNPWLPMTYTNDGIRRAVAGGPQSPYVWIDLAVLTGVAVLALALTMWGASHHRRMSLADLDPSVELV
jgi:putative membrane protein